MREVTEGAFSTAAAASLARRLGVDMPITFALDGVLNQDADLDRAISALIEHLGTSVLPAPRSTPR